MREELKRVRSSWHRLLITMWISSLLLIIKFKLPRARVHWIGRHHRPRRRERVFGFLLIIGAMLFLEPREYIIWSALWGGGLAIYLNLHTVYLLIPRRR